MAPVLTPETPLLAPRPARGQANDGAQFRRALVLMFMTLVLPGSAQVVAGRKQTGRIALRIWFGLIATVIVLFGLGMVFDSFVFWLLSNTVVLGILRIVLMLVAVGWAYLFIDAWRLGDPLVLRQKQRLAMVGINGVLCFTVAGGLLFASHVVAVQKDFVSAMFTNGQATGAHAGRYNILLLGGDSGADRWGLRPDSLSVASIDAETGDTVLFGLPRNMLNFPFPEGSIMGEQFPNGYDCGGQCELNSLATYAADHKSLFAGVPDPAVEATKEGVEGITGLKINYYAMVNLQGFEKLVDAVGGVTLNVRDSIPIGGIGAPVTGHIKPGKRKLNGFETLWFARSRVAADDYSRMARQKCVMNAMLHQLSPQTVVLNFDKIAKASQALISTDLPEGRGRPVHAARAQGPQQAGAHGVLRAADDLDRQPRHRQDPRRGEEGDRPLRGRRTEEEGPEEGRGHPGAEPDGTTGGSIGNLKQGYAANQAEDLSSAC